MSSKRNTMLAAVALDDSGATPPSTRRSGTEQLRIFRDRIVPDPEQPRKTFDEPSLLRLAADLQERGQPKDGKALHNLLAAGVTGTRLVVWLDDLQNYLSTEGVSPDVLNRFHAQGNVLVATIRSAAYEALVPAGELRPAGWEVPGWFGDPVWLIRWTEADLDRAAAAGIPAKVLAGARRHGLSAYLGGGPLALDRLRTAETTHRLGHALVRATVDWRRVGVSSPVPHPVLVALAPVYLGHQSRAASGQRGDGSTGTGMGDDPN